MNRRVFLAVSGQTAMLALAGRAAKSAGVRPAEVTPTLLTAVEQRVAAVIEAYDAQGNHRTGSQVDRQSGEPARLLVGSHSRRQSRRTGPRLLLRRVERP